MGWLWKAFQGFPSPAGPARTVLGVRALWLCPPVGWMEQGRDGVPGWLHGSHVLGWGWAWARTEDGPRLVTEGTCVRWLPELWVVPQLMEVIFLQLPKTPLYVLVRALRTGSLDPPCHASHILEASAMPMTLTETLPRFPWAVLAVVGAARPPASATPRLPHSLVFSEGYGRQQLPPGGDSGAGALWEVGGCPLIPLCSLPAHPTEHQVPRGLLRGALGDNCSAPLLLPKAPAQLEPVPEPGAPRGITLDPAGCSSLCTPMDSGLAAHGLCDAL